MSDQPPQDNQDAQSPQDLDSALKDAALSQIQAAVKGNGVKPEDIGITSYAADILEFQAVTKIELRSKLALKEQAGKITGPKLVPTQAAFQEETGREIHKILRSNDVIQKIRDQILERSDKGIAIKDQLIVMQFLHRDFVAHEQCGSCKAHGKIQCTRCHGKGMETCPRCNGSGHANCSHCAGRQYVQQMQNGKPQNQPCTVCGGSGKQTCGTCNGGRSVACNICKRAGTITCTRCNGHAWTSVMCMAAIDGFANYEYDRAGLPEKAIAKIDGLGSKLPAHTHIQILNAPNDPNNDFISLDYQIVIPSADMQFSIKNMDVPAYLFGTQGKLYDAPPFLEKVMKNGIVALKAAGKGEGNIAAHLKTAARYRTLRNILALSIKTNPKKALAITMKDNPLGLRKDMAKMLIVSAHKAVKAMTQKPRQTAFVLSSIIALGLGTFYALWGREQLQPFLPNTNATYAADGLTALLCIALGYIIFKVMSKSAMKKGLQSILQKGS